MKRYCITDSLGVSERAAQDGVEMIQIRAKELSARDLSELVRAVLRVADSSRILVNTRTDVALACGAHGVHLPAGSMAPGLIRPHRAAGFLIGVSCHTIDELRAADREAADFAVYGPVFPSVTKSLNPIGIEAFREAAAASVCRCMRWAASRPRTRRNASQRVRPGSQAYPYSQLT